MHHQSDQGCPSVSKATVACEEEDYKTVQESPICMPTTAADSSTHDVVYLVEKINNEVT